MIGRYCLWLAPLGLVFASACVAEEDPIDVPALDADRYAAEVQPFVAQSCATLDCHGQGGRPLRLYSELGLRQDDGLRRQPIEDGVTPTALTAPELEANVRGFAGLLPALSPGKEDLIRSKPLAEDAGGDAHVGGDLFADKDAPGYRCLDRWLKGSSSNANSCAEALAALPDPWP